MNDLAPKLKQFRTDLTQALPTFGLATERDQKRMSSVLMVAVEKDPELLFSDRQSLIAAVRQCSNHGLVPDGNEATLQVYNSKVKINGKETWIKKVQYQPMVRGIIHRIQRSGKVSTVWAEVVYEGEVFKIDISQGDRRPVHDPDFFNRSGEIIGVYAVAKMANGSIDCEPISMKELLKIRAVAKTKNVWDNWLEEKAKVAALRRLSKRLPLASDDIEMIMNADEHEFPENARNVTPEAKGMAAIAEDARRTAHEAEKLAALENQQTLEPGEEEKPKDPVKKATQKKEPASKGNTVSPKDESVIDGSSVEVDKRSKGFKDGTFAGESGLGRGNCPQDQDAVYVANWFAGYDQAAGTEK